MTSRSRLSLVVAVIFAGLLIAALLKRCGSPQRFTQADPISKTAGENPQPLPSPVETADPDPPKSPPTVETPAKPSERKRSLVVTDIFGAKVRGAEISVSRGGLGGKKIVTGEDGQAEIPHDLSEDSFLYCGAYHLPLKALRRGAPFDIPGIAKPTYGELAILPLDWDDLRVSLQGQQSWSRAAATDERLGHRYLYLRPGTYEIADRRPFVLGTAEVIAGQRTTYVVTKWCGLKINLSFVVEPEGPTSMIAVMLKGVSAGASFSPNATGFLMSGRADQRTYTYYGIMPGTYRVYADHDHYYFSESLMLPEGRVRILEVRLQPR